MALSAWLALMRLVGTIKPRRTSFCLATHAGGVYVVD
jgi:hypothetical protein